MVVRVKLFPSIIKTHIVYYYITVKANVKQETDTEPNHCLAFFPLSLKMPVEQRSFVF